MLPHVQAQNGDALHRRLLLHKAKQRSVVCSYQVSSHSKHACIAKGGVKQMLKTVTRTLCTPRSAIYHKICRIYDTIMI